MFGWQGDFIRLSARSCQFQLASELIAELRLPADHENCCAVHLRCDALSRAFLTDLNAQLNRQLACSTDAAASSVSAQASAAEAAQLLLDVAVPAVSAELEQIAKKRRDESQQQQEERITSLPICREWLRMHHIYGYCRGGGAGVWAV